MTWVNSPKFRKFFGARLAYVSSVGFRDRVLNSPVLSEALEDLVSLSVDLLEF